MLEKIKKAIQKNNMESAWIMIYFVDQVLMGRYKDGNIIFADTEYNENNILEVHIFNKEKELRSGNNLTFVEIPDPEDAKNYFTEKFFILDEVKNVETVNGQTITTLGRNGRMVKIPMAVPNNPLRLVVHHMFDKDTGFLEKYRLVDIEGEGGE